MTKAAIKAFLCLPLICFTTNALCATITIHSAAELETAVSQAKPGDHILIANGRYSGWSCRLKGNGRAGNPIVIQAALPGGVSFGDSVLNTIFTLTGSYLELHGIVFEACKLQRTPGKNPTLVELENAQYCRVTGCTFQKNEAVSQFMPLVMVSGNGEANQIDHCSFTSNVNNMDVSVKITKETVPVHTLIANNAFAHKAKVTWPVFNGGECIQVGQDPVLLGNQRAFTTVIDNRFIQCDGEPEVISNKSSDNRYIHNYFENCQGELVMRGGHDCIIDSNTIKGGAGGIRVNGSHHTITHNQISDVPTGIRLMYGMARGKTEPGFYIAATDCIIADNEISRARTGILDGDSKNADWTGKFDVKKYPSRTIQDVAPADNVFRNNTITGTSLTPKL